MLVWDNESAVGSWQGGRPRLTGEFAAFAGTLGISVWQCRPRDPEAKGLVERANGYLETSFLPGRVFTSPADFNTQLTDWITTRANTRQHRALGCRPIQRWDTDRAAMLALAPVAPLVGWTHAVRLPRDHYVRLAGNDYSVDPAVIGRRVQVTADLTEVRITCDGTVVGEQERCWASHQTITDPAHAQAALRLRASYRAAVASSAAPASTSASAKTASTAGAATQVATRPLSDYDSALLAGRAHALAAATSGGAS